MFSISPTAQEKILERIKMEGKEDSTLRIRIVGWTADDFQYRLEVIPDEAIEDEDVQVQDGELKVLLAGDSVERMQGASLDFLDGPDQRGFSMDNPNPVWTDPLEIRVQRALDEHINPGVGMHGGQVRLMKLEGSTAVIEFGGGCVGCGMSQVTLRQGVERILGEQVPEITQILDSTDHASGTNPYYAPQAEPEEAASPLA